MKIYRIEVVMPDSFDINKEAAQYPMTILLDIVDFMAKRFPWMKKRIKTRSEWIQQETEHLTQ